MAVPASAAAGHIADIAGFGAGRVLFGLSNVIIDAANNVRANAALAGAIARRVSEIVNVLAQALDDVDSTHMEQPLKEALGGLRQTLSDLSELLVNIKTRSYLSQILHQQRDKERLIAISTHLENTFDLMTVKTRIQSSLMAAGLASEVDRLTSRHLEKLSLDQEAPLEGISRLPPRPHLHFGRAAETQAAVDIVAADPPGSAAILGGPGMGKTTLALAVLHDPSVAQRFGAKRFFVRCDAAEDQSSCLVTISDAFGIVAASQSALQKKLLVAISTEPALLVLDNFESAWEASSQRAGAEDVLRLLDGMPNLALLVTMRGNERPSGVSWTRPFLPPMTPLSDTAAKQAFFSIADASELDPTIGTLIDRLDNVPLAIVLMANLAQFAPPETLLQRWNELSTSVLRRGSGTDRLTSLDVSIELSLGSPRMLDVPEAKTLLSVLAILPHGVVDTDVSQWDIDPSQHVLSTLLRTALASRRLDGRVYVLAPIREFMLAQYPPTEAAIAPVFRHYFALAELAHESVKFTFDGEAISAVAPELGNIDAAVRYALRNGSSDVRKAAITAASRLCSLFSETSMGTGHELLPVALAAARHDGFDDLCGDLLFLWGRLSFNSSLPGDPRALYSEARAVYERAGNADGVLDIDITLSQFLAPADAAAEALRCAAVAESRGDVRRAARGAFMCARAHERGGRPRDAIAQHRAAISLVQGLAGDAGAERLVGVCQYGLAENLKFLADFPGALAAYGAALAIFEALRFPNGQLIIYGQLAHLLQLQGKPADAIERATRALAVPGAPGVRAYKDCLLTIVESNSMLGNWDASEAALARLDQFVESEALSNSERSMMLATRAGLACTRGDTAEARVLAEAALQAARSGDHVKSRQEMLHKEANVLLLLASIDYEAGNSDDALVTSILSAVQFTTVQDTVSPIFCLVQLAEAADDELAERVITALLLPIHRLGLSYDLAKLLLRSSAVARSQGDLALARSLAKRAIHQMGDVKDDYRLRIAAALSER